MRRTYTKEEWSAKKESLENAASQELKDRYSGMFAQDETLSHLATSILASELSYVVRRRAVELTDVLASHGHKVPLTLREVQDPQRYPEAYFCLLQDRHGWTWGDMPALLDDMAEYWLSDGAMQKKE